jgi:cysteine desulfurase
LDVDKNGIISLDHLKKSIRPDTILVSIMYANNEIGTIQPIKKISKILKESKISNPIFHTDACQAVGALPINVLDLGVDSLTISSSKLYGPKGVGCLYLNKKYKIEPIIFGGGQEKGARAGTENVASIVGFAEALVISDKKRVLESKRLTALRDYFLSQIFKKIKDVSLNGSKEERLPNNINISIRGVEGESLLLLLDNVGISCSTGSACSSSDLAPSHVLVSIGLPLELAHCSLRFTLGRYTKKSDIDYTVKMLDLCVKKIRNLSSLK